jgi:hypothetical protein
LTAGLKEGFKGSPEGLNVDVEEAGLNLRILMPNSLHEAKGVRATDLGTPQVANRFVPAPHALKEGDLRGDLTVRRAIDVPFGPEHFIQVLSGDNVLEDPIAILRLASCIKEVDPRCDEESRRVELGLVAVRSNPGLKSTELPRYRFQRGSGHNFDLEVSGHLLYLIVYYAGEAFVSDFLFQQSLREFPFPPDPRQQ